MIFVKTKLKMEEETHDWIPCGHRFKGVYRTPYGNWWGLVSTLDGEPHNYYIFDPPLKLRSSKFWPNFYSVSQGWFAICFVHDPENLLKGIRIVEKVLCEAFETKNE